MISIINYNIHDLLKIRIIENEQFDLGRKLKYSFFESDEDNKEPDIVLNIGKFKPSNNNCDIISHKYHIKENYFYCKDKGKKTKWEIEIYGFEKGKTVINFDGEGLSLKNILFPSFLSQDFLIPIIEYKLAQKNYFLIHAGAISKESNAYMFAGRMGAFKTTLIMDFIRKANFDYLGDDRIIINDKILCFPTSLFLFEFMLNNMSTEKRGLLDNIRLLNNILKRKQIDNIPIVRYSKPKALFFISKEDRNNVKTAESSLKRGVDKLIINNKTEFVTSTPTTPSGQFYKYILIYSLIFPDNMLVKHWDILRKGLEKSLKDLPIYEIVMPHDYNLAVFNNVMELVNKE